MSLSKKTAYRYARNITLLGGIANTLMALAKLIGGWLFHSHALIADGIHSLSDLLSDVMVLFAAKYGSQDPDESHPYGHKRIETVAVWMLSILLIAAGLGIAWDAIKEIIALNNLKPDFSAFIVAAVVIIINELLFHLTFRIGKKIQSSLIIANAWHRRSDTAASLVVAIGVLGAWFNIPYLDAIAAIIVALMICKVGIKYAWESIQELVDTAAPPVLLKKIREIIKVVDGVQAVHDLRSRFMGGDLLIDVHILVSPTLSVSEGHHIAQDVHRTLFNEVDKVKEVMVHVDPEDDEKCCPSIMLPSREKLVENLFNPWKKDFPEIVDWTLHYLDGFLDITVVVSSSLHSKNLLMKRLEKDLKTYDNINTICLMSLEGVVIRNDNPP